MPVGIVAANWKMNTTLQEAGKLVAEMKPGLEAIGGIQVVVCPPFVYLEAVGEMLRGSSVLVGAQNMHDEEKGAYTGEVSPAMLAELCRFVILGHSERRQHFGETDELINRKVRAALRAALKPILCVGERLEDRERGEAETLVERQLNACLEGVDSAAELAVAYEPVWAIGTGMAATPDVAQSMMARIRAVLGSRFGQGAAADVPLLYGGSVNAGNISSFAREGDIDGALVGGASLEAGPFVEIVRKIAQVQA